MRVLHLADSHLGAWQRAWGAPDDWHRGQDHEAAFRRALQPALDERVDLVVHAGDIFDGRRPGRQVVTRCLDLLAEVCRRVPVVVIPGNHDPPSLQRCFRLPPKGLQVVDMPTRLCFGELAIAAVPFRRGVAGFADAARTAVGKGVDALLMHQAVHLCRVPNFVFRVKKPLGTIGKQHLPLGVRWAFCGHIHPRQVVEVGATTVVYPGALERTQAREGPEPKGYVLWDFSGPVSWRYVDLPTRPFYGIMSQAELQQVGPGHLVRIAESPAYAEIFRGVQQRGGWVTSRRPDQPPLSPAMRAEQQRLFPR